MERHRSQLCKVGSNDTLVIRTKMPRGEINILEMRQSARSYADVQTIIDTVTDDGETVISVWLVEAHEVSGLPLSVEDLTDEFDVRSTQQIIEDAKRMEREARNWAFTQQSNGTHNHRQQGIGR